MVESRKILLGIGSAVFNGALRIPTVSVEDFFRQYFLAPIDERTGYNVVNTAVYAAVALLAAYIIYKGLRKLGVKVDEGFVLSIVPFVLFGSTLRVVVDANILPYSYFTVTPGIYFLVGFATLASVLACNRLGVMGGLWKVGAVLWVASLLPLLPLPRYPEFFGLALLLAIAGFFAGGWLLKLLKLEAKQVGGLVIFSHALDGAATFVTLDIFSSMTGHQYFEQHVVTNALAQMFGGFWVFYVIKILFATLAVYVVRRSSDMDENERNYIFLLLMIFGLAPGVRDALRLLCGV